MNIAYIKDMDSLYIELHPENATQAWEAHEGIVLNLSEDGRVVGIEIEQASTRVDMGMLKVGNFPGEVHSVEGKAH